MSKIAIVYYSQTGTNHAMALAAAAGAEAEGAEVRVLIVPELAPAAAIERNEGWQKFRETVADAPVATLDDLEWADAVIFGTPTRFGNPASQLSSFLDTAGGLWARGVLAGKVYAAFTSAATLHGGHEATLLSLSHYFYHFGGVIVTVGYNDASVNDTGNPYGPSVQQTRDGSRPNESELAHARALGALVATTARKLRG